MLDGALDAADWNGFGKEESFFPCGEIAGKSCVGLSGMDRRAAHGDGGHRNRRGWRGYGLQRHAGNGAGPGDDVHATDRGSSRRSGSEHPDRAGRHRPGERRRQRRLALGVRRRIRRRGGWAQDGREAERDRCRGAGRLRTSSCARVARIAGTDRSISLSELAARQPTKAIRVAATETPSTPSWPNGAQVAEVEIDPETGEVTLAALTSCDDIGRIINHADRGRSDPRRHGAGRGQALWEQVRYDEASGQLFSGSLMDLRRAPTSCRRSRHFDESALQDEPARRERLRRARHDRRGPCGARGARRARAAAPRDAAHRREGLAGAAP